MNTAVLRCLRVLPYSYHDLIKSTKLYKTFFSANERKILDKFIELMYNINRAGELKKKKKIKNLSHFSFFSIPNSINNKRGKLDFK